MRLWPSGKPWMNHRMPRGIRERNSRETERPAKTEHDVETPGHVNESGAAILSKLAAYSGKSAYENFNATALVCYSAYKEGLADRRRDVHDRFISYGRDLHRRAVAKHGDDIEDFEYYRIESLRYYLLSPPREASVTGKGRAWELIPVADKRAVWDDVKERLILQARFMRLDPDVLFPAPEPEQDGAEDGDGGKTKQKPPNKP